eukprot:TRINITY_DN15013_c0_g2_i1.p1 TRINITY_DN15013_c0_g2~~TRINITY_DN15013_c0_g2_i1.p1  ORF type:complete len:522 (+),score=105.66 TRINITY_DN15013_c0_g2_i1:52-1617(+)
MSTQAVQDNNVVGQAHRPSSSCLGRELSMLIEEEFSKRHQKDVQAFPNFVALASRTKDKEVFGMVLQHQLSPQSSTADPTDSVLSSPVQFPCLPSATASPPPLEGSRFMQLEGFELDGRRECSSDEDSREDASQREASPTRELASKRADFFWKLAGDGTPKVKPLDMNECESDGSAKAGVYLLQSPKVSPSQDPFPFSCIFKPSEEETFQRRGIAAGGGASREEAAYKISWIHGGHAHVPSTWRAGFELGTLKHGSLQEFDHGSVGPVENFGMPRSLADAVKVVALDEAQAVVCHDICIFNTDRHAGNLLLSGPKPYRVTCIDHGCILPAWWALEQAGFDAWIQWPHIREQATAATVNLIKQSVDTLQKVKSELVKLELEPQAIWTFRISSLLLQCGVLKHNLTLHQVARLMMREDGALAEPSWLERQVETACKSAGVQAGFVDDLQFSRNGDKVFEVESRITDIFRKQGTLSEKEATLLADFESKFFASLDTSFNSPEMRSAALKAEKDATEAILLPWRK